MDIVNSSEAKGKNARQLMLALKSGHGTGENLTFPVKEDIDQAMCEFSDERLVDIFGDGSHTTPKTWWASLGGSGLWVPEWNKENEEDPMGFGKKARTNH